MIIAACVPYCAHGQDKNLYKEAFKYIRNKYAGERLTVSDTILHLGFAEFSKRISAIWKKDKVATENFLDTLDVKQIDLYQYCASLKTLKQKGKRPGKAVFFSDIFRNLLVVEVMVMDEKSKLTHDSQSLFNKSIKYLFWFDEKSKIGQVFEDKIQYN